MTEFDAVYYDGRTSARRPVRVRWTGASLHVSGPQVNLELPLESISVDAPLAGSSRALQLPDGAQLRTDDHAAVESLFARRPLSARPHLLEGWVHGLERRWPYALAAVVFVAAFAWWAVADGLPLSARFAAGFVPPPAEAKLGEQTLAFFEKRLCKPSALPAARQEALQARFAALSGGLADGYAYRLLLRDCGGVGANAFALPGGAVVMTDALVKLAKSDDQIAAVLAHEIGHVRHRHGLRSALQAAGLAALTAAVLGDVVSITSLAVTLPTVILQSRYSRSFETEADDYAFQRLKELGISPRAFGEMMALLEAGERRRAAAKSGEALDYFSTHPSTAKRIERAEAAASELEKR
jgi:Zn-dependent protease with chaperone function